MTYEELEEHQMDKEKEVQKRILINPHENE